MGDVRDILQVNPGATAPSMTGKKKSSAAAAAAAAAKKPKNMSRELFNLQQHSTTPETMEVEEQEVGAVSLRKFKIDPSVKARAWEWARFQNSARRSEDKDPLKHWSRRDIAVEDYPFCRFNKPCYVVAYTVEEHSQYVTEFPDQWTREDDFILLQLCKRFDCRWPVISDRFPVTRSTLQCRTRYFYLAKLAVQHNVKNFTAEEERDPKLTFDCRAAIKSFNPMVGLHEEKFAALDRLFFQTQEDQRTEEELLKGMKLVEDEIKKLKLERKRVEEAAKVKKNKQKVVPYRPEENEASVSDLAKLLHVEIPQQLAWKRSSLVHEPHYLLSATQAKQFALYCNVKPEIPTEAVLQVFRAYREDSLRLVVHQHAVKRMKSEIKQM